MVNKLQLSAVSKWPWLVLTPVLLFILVAILAPWISPYDPAAQNYSAVLQGSSWQHWLGTDYLGRDLLSRILSGARVSLVSMSIVLTAALAIGVIVGSFSGYIGGKTDQLLISTIDIILSLPSLIVTLAFIGIIGPGYWSMIAALTMAWWANYARMSRAAVISELHQPYIEAARVMGAGPLHIFIRHILPHVLGMVVVYASADAGALVLAIATLSFLGLGVEPPTPEWGQMLVDGMNYLEQYPRLVILPGLALTLVVTGFNLLGEHFTLKKVPNKLGKRRLQILKHRRIMEENLINEQEAKV